MDIKEQKEGEDLIEPEVYEPKPFTFQAYLEHLNNSEPKSDFALWKALELARFVRTQMREDLVYWLNHPEDWKSIKG